MSKSLENPFHSLRDAPTDLVAFAEQGFLPPDEVAKLKELESQKNRSSEFGIRHSMSDVSLEEGMSMKERRAFNEVREKHETRQRLIEWADEWNLGDEDWVDETFSFQPNGTVVCDEYLDMPRMRDPDFPDFIIEVTGDLHLDNLTSAEHLKLPITIGGSLYLQSLTSAEHLVLPTTIGRHLSVSGLTSAEHLVLPTTIGRDLYLTNLASAEHLKLPTTIGGDLYLRRLTSAKYLELTDVRGIVYLDRLSNEEKDKIRKKYPDLTIE